MFLIFNSIITFSKPIKENRQLISITTLAEGVVHTNEIIYNFSDKKSNLQNINYIEMDLNLLNSSYSLMCFKANGKTSGKQTLIDQLITQNNKKHDILGGINGDFFNLSNGIPVCNNVMGGEFFSTSLSRYEEILRPSFCIFENGDVNIDNYHFVGNVKFIDDSKCFMNVKIDGINRNDNLENTINIFNYKNNEHSCIYFPEDREDALLVLIEPYDNDTSFKNLKKINGKITKIIRDPENIYKLSKNEIGIVSYGDKNALLPHLKVGMETEFEFLIKNSSNLLPYRINFLITAHEFIIKDGVIKNKDYYAKTWNVSSACAKNHRSAIALTTRNTLIFFTVDKKDSFKGMTLNEVGEFLKSKDAHTAINLDGGGSTCMIIKDEENKFKTVNLPRENRKISNSIMIKKANS